MKQKNNEEEIKLGDRMEIIKKYIKGRDVLDLGCVDHDDETRKEHIWLHKFIVDNSRSTLGIDTEKEEIEKLKDIGYNVMYGNVENMVLGGEFDVIVAGELIEHLHNPGRFLINIKKNLKKEGFLILTTPNPYNFRNIYNILFKKTPKVRKDHTCYYCPQTISFLARKNGFSVVDVFWINRGHSFSKMALISLFRRWWSPNFLIVLRKSKNFTVTDYVEK